jgi:superoxide dismutase
LADGAGALPMLTVDVWEHAYYLDYQTGAQTTWQRRWAVT